MMNDGSLGVGVGLGVRAAVLAQGHKNAFGFYCAFC